MNGSLISDGSLRGSLQRLLIIFSENLEDNWYSIFLNDQSGWQVFIFGNRP